MMPVRKSEIPFVVFLIPFITGIWCGITFNLGAGSLLPAAVIAGLAIALILLNLFYRKFKLYQFRWLGGVLVQLFLFVSAWAMAMQAKELNDDDHFSKKSSDHLLVRINSAPKISNGIVRFTAIVLQTIKDKQTSKSIGNLLLLVKTSTDSTLFYGDLLLIPSAYTLIDAPANPAEFNYKKYLADQNIHYRQMLNAGQYLRIARETGNPLINFSLRARLKLVVRLKKYLHEPEAIGVASTLILGYKADLDEDTYLAYSKTGTVHVLSVSGAQVAILVILLEWALSFLKGIRYGRFVKACIILFITWYYALLTGFSPAVCRAALMVSFVIAGNSFSKTINTLNILALSAFLLLIIKPFYLYDIGFQLSYLAVGGLIVVQPTVYKCFKFKNKWADKVWKLCALSLTAQLVTLPLSAFYFHQFPVYFLLSNLVVIIPAALVMYAGIAYLVLDRIHFLGKLLGYLLEKTILALDTALHMIEYAPFANVEKIWLTPASEALLCLLILAVINFLFFRTIRSIRVTLFMLLLFSASISIKRYNNLHTNEIVLFTIAKHRAMAFKSGDQAVILTDLNDTNRSFKYAVQPYLDSCQVTELSLIKPDADYSNAFFIKKRNLVEFGTKALMIFNKSIRITNLPHKIQVDFLFLPDGMAKDIRKIDKNFDYKKLILFSNGASWEASKKPHLIRAGKRKYVVITGNKSLTLASN